MDTKILIVQNDHSTHLEERLTGTAFHLHPRIKARSAAALEERLIALGYTVCASVSSEQEAIEKAADMRPDLALIDLGLSGDTDGVEVAEQIGSQMPVLYLMDEVEEDLLQRAEATQPFGYVIKSVDERQLHLNIQTALSQYKKERKHRETEREMDQKINELQHQAQRMETILDSISDGVIAADENGDYLIFNSSAKRIVGTYNPGTDLNHRSEEYGLFFPDRVTLFPSDDLPLARAIRGASSDDVEVFVSNPNLPEGTYISISGRPLQPDKSGVKGGVIVFRDISKDKEAEAKLEQAVGELHDQTQLMETVFENINNGVILSDATNRILFMNASARRLLGTKIDAEVPDIPVNERSETYGIFYPDGKTHVPTDHLPLVRAVKGEETEEMALLFRNEQNVDGAYVRIRGIPVLDRDGKVVKAGMAILRDFTEHKSLEDRLAQIDGEPGSGNNGNGAKADVPIAPDIAGNKEMENGSNQKIIEDLREQLQLMEAIFDNLNDGIIVASPMGQILFANKTTEKIFGTWIVDPNMSDWSKTFGVYYPDIKTPVPIEQLPLTRALYGEETEEMEVFIRNQKNTEGTHISARGRPILSSDETEVIAGLAVLRDITQKRETEARLEQTVSELRDQTQLLETVFDNMNDGLVVADKTGNLILYNASAEQIFGMKDVHVEPEKWSETYGIFNSDQKTLLPIEQYPLIRAMQGESIDEMEFFVRNENRPQGTYISASARPLMSSDNSEVVASVGIIRNITKRKTAEAKLEQTMREQRRQAQLLETIFNSISDGVIVADAEGTFTIFNPSAEQIVGIGMLDTPPEQWTEQYGIFLPDEKTHLPTDQIPLVRAIQGKNTDNLELFIRNEGKPDGVHISVSGRPLQKDIDGHGGGVVVFHDITARKKAEAKLEQTNREQRNQNELLETVLNTIGDGIIIVDRDEGSNYALYHNPSAEEISGIDRLDVSPTVWAKKYGVFHTDQKTHLAARDLPIIRIMGRGESLQDEVVFIRNEKKPDGVYVQTSGRPLLYEDGRIRGAVIILRDITERKNAEIELEQTARELRNQNELIETAFNSISDGIAIADLYERSFYANPSAQQITGIDAVTGPLVDWPQRHGVFYPDQKTIITLREQPLARILFRGESIDDRDMFIRNEEKPEGVYIRLSGRPLRNESGKIRGAVITFRDVTEQMINEEALRQAFAQGRLEVVDTILHNIGNAINSVTTGMDTIYRQLSNDPISRRFSALANAIEARRENWVDYIQNDPQGQQVLPFVIALAEDFNQQNARLVKTVGRVSERTDHIADIIRTQKSLGGLQVVRKDIHLRDAIHSAVKVLQESLDRRKTEIAVNCENAPREIRIQESQFHQMMVNLIKNAMEAIDDLTAMDGLREPPRISIRAYEQGNFLNIDVSDNGIGIPKENARKIFSAGYTTKNDGSGLGLHSAANFVIGSGGQIQSLSDGIGSGTTIQIMLRLTSVMPPRESGGGGAYKLRPIATWDE